MFKFTDASDIYTKYCKLYKKHSRGYVILAPPGTGKTTYVNNQNDKLKNWIDSDILFGNNGLNIRWMNQNCPIDERLAYLRADYMLEQSKIFGFRIIGALFWEYKADAVVLIPFEQHKLYYKSRSDLDILKIKKWRQIFLEHA